MRMMGKDSISMGAGACLLLRVGWELESIAGMKRSRTTGDKVMIALLSFAIFLFVTLGIFDIVSMAAYGYNTSQGLRALLLVAVLLLSCYGALRKRLDGLVK
jgi:ABC-type xylose transport system permease subunit